MKNKIVAVAIVECSIDDVYEFDTQEEYEVFADGFVCGASCYGAGFSRVLTKEGLDEAFLRKEISEYTYKNALKMLETRLKAINEQT